MCVFTCSSLKVLICQFSFRLRFLCFHLHEKFKRIWNSNISHTKTTTDAPKDQMNDHSSRDSIEFFSFCCAEASLCLCSQNAFMFSHSFKFSYEQRKSLESRSVHSICKEKTRVRNAVKELMVDDLKTVNFHKIVLIFFGSLYKLYTLKHYKMREDWISIIMYNCTNSHFEAVRFKFPMTALLFDEIFR